MKPSGELLDSDAAAIAEIVASAKDQKIYRVKMHDKTPALALMTRILERLNKQDEQTDDDSEEARDFLLEELDRLSAEIAAEEDNGEPAETHHPVLEDQMCAFTQRAHGDGVAAGGSPDRVDALVWALTDLLLVTTPGAGIAEYYHRRAEEGAGGVGRVDPGSSRG